MAYLPPPGLASLPAKPPVSTAPKTNSSSGGIRPAFTAFAPRNVASTAPRTHNPPQYSALPTTNYSAQASYSAAPHQVPSPSVYQAPTQYETGYQSSPPIRNPFVPTAFTATPSAQSYGTYDPEYEAQVQQWQSAYTSRDDKPNYGVPRPTAPAIKPDAAPQNGTATSTVTGSGTATGSGNGSTAEVQKTVKREGGGSTWTDPTLLEWDPAHFRIFVGNLAGEVTDDSLLKAFSKFPSVQKARVIRDKRTTKSKGFGFVSFADGDDYFQAAREMQGKYIGSHPVLIKRATTEVKPTVVQSKHKHGKNGRKKDRDSAGAHGTVEYGGVQKKAPKTKGGLRVLG